jgi:hypothetical protein
MAAQACELSAHVSASGLQVGVCCARVCQVYRLLASTPASVLDVNGLVFRQVHGAARNVSYDELQACLNLTSQRLAQTQHEALPEVWTLPPPTTTTHPHHPHSYPPAPSNRCSPVMPRLEAVGRVSKVGVLWLAGLRDHPVRVG